MGSGNQATVEIVEVAKSRWLRNQSVDRVRCSDTYFAP